jgi:hypothetical protein
MAEGGSPLILIDGPMAGHVLNTYPDASAWVVRIPKRFTLFGSEAPQRPFMNDDACYSITTVRCTHPLLPEHMPVRVGTVKPSSELDQRNLDENVWTGLAELGMLPWDQVPATGLDRWEPVLGSRDADAGNPLIPCVVTVGGRFGPLPDEELVASCECGWRTDPKPLNRRAQLMRAAHAHELDAPRRRELLDAPIPIADRGTGPRSDCYAGLRSDDDWVTGYALCSSCGWRTEPVERFRGKMLQQAFKDHTGPGGVRRVRNQVREALGEPLLPEPSTDLVLVELQEMLDNANGREATDG